MALDWNDYPTSGRTQWFGGGFADRPCGVGYGYTVVTTGAKGIYKQFNEPWQLRTREDTDPALLHWDSDSIPPGFSGLLILSRSLNAISEDITWVLSCVNLDITLTFLSVVVQVEPNLRLRFTTPTTVNPFSLPIENIPNGFTITPLTRQQATI